MVQVARPAPFSNAPTDDAIDFNRRMAARLMQQGTSTEPVGHWTAALARALQGASGSMWNDQARQGEQDAEASVQAALSGKMDPKQLMMNPRTRGIGLQMYSSAQADARAEARERRAEERAARDPYRQAQIAALQAEAQAKAAREQRRSSLMGELLGDGGGGGMPAQRPPMPQTQPVAPGYQPIPQQGGPRLQPQSNLSPDVMPGGITRIADAPQGMPQQSMPAQQTQPQEPSVELFGRQVPVSRARSVGQRMLLDPETATLGKAILDSIGTAQGAGMRPQTAGTIEEKQFNTTESLARLNNIRQMFRPEFQQIENRLGYAWSEFASKFRAGQAKVTPQQQQELADFSAYRASAIDNLNNYIKEITGAAMTNAEAGRILKGMPNPGEGIFDGDSPVSFQAKLDAAIKRSQLALARYNYLRKNGFAGGVEEASKRIPLERMGDVIQQRTDAIVQDITSKNPGIGVDQLKPVIRQRLRAEFGIDA